MMIRRTLEGAVKCALRDLRLEELTFGLNFISASAPLWLRLLPA